MTVAQRIRKIREVRGWKQTTIAGAMGITQQAYSCLEQESENARLRTLKRFCEQMNVTLAFLLSNVPITDETVKDYGPKPYDQVIEERRKVAAKLELMEELLMDKKGGRN